MLFRSGQAVATLDIGWIQFRKSSGDFLIVRADGPILRDHLVPPAGLVSVEPGSGVGSAHGQHGEVPGACDSIDSSRCRANGWEKVEDDE